jgi:hypothetical protein
MLYILRKAMAEKEEYFANDDNEIFPDILCKIRSI